MSTRKGPEGFEAYYAKLFGTRWPELREALLQDAGYYELDEGLLKPYYLDEASVTTALSLEAGGGLRLLDLCAAPGGKSLILATKMSAEASLVCNERSGARRNRLRTVLDEHLPEDVRRRVEVTGHDARTWGLHEQNLYDRVLADVPCSSERHVLSSPVHLKQWGPARSKRLAAQSVAILAAAVDAAAPGGLIVYSTCTVLEAENDRVVSRILERRNDVVDLYRPEVSMGEETETGVRIWPDASGGYGPMFISRLRKREAL